MNWAYFKCCTRNKFQWLWSCDQWSGVYCTGTMYMFGKSTHNSSVKHGSLHICQFSSSIFASRLWPRHRFFFCSLILNPWETFLSQQIKGGWVRRQGPDQLSQTAISTVLSFWHTRKIWALSEAEGPSASQASYFPPFYFTVTFHCSLSFPQPLSLYPFHPSFLCSLNL